MIQSAYMKSTRKRTTRSVTLVVRVTPDTVSKLDDLAAVLGTRLRNETSRSDAARMAIGEGIERLMKEKD